MTIVAPRVGTSMECPCCQSQVSSSAKNCDVCGEPIPPGQYMLEESGIVEPSKNATSAPAPPSRIHNSGQYRFARLGDRFLAFSLDLAVLFGLFAIIDAWVFMRLGTVSATELQLTTASLLLAITSNALMLFLYGWLMEASCGATLGKAIIGIRVVGTSQRGPLAACALRNVFRIVDGIGFYLVGTVSAACSGARQRLGDVYAQTAVIEDNFGRVMRVMAFVLWLGILAGAGWTVPRICSSNDSLQTPFLGQVILRVGRSGHSVYFKVARMSVDVQLASAEQ
ncbi:MAG TPA: RDD family protein [Terriglobales bacterium]|nr:RDD family protein [Terriglobales bacterium]